MGFFSHRKVWATLVAALQFSNLVCTASTFQPSGVPFKAPVTVASGLSASIIFSNLTAPRGITFDTKQNLLVVERGFGITAFSPTNTPEPGWERTVVISNPNFTQGIQVDGVNLYVSTATTTYLYKYDARTKTVASNTAPIPIITGIPGDGDLTTHTLQLEQDATGRPVAILVADGPLSNIDVTARDPASGRSQVRRFTLPPSGINFSSPPAPQSWASGQIIAFGIRNPAGFAFPPAAIHSSGEVKTLVVVENGASIDGLANLTSAFVNDNPSDELELVSYSTKTTNSIPKSYGFPDCTSLWNPLADPVGNPSFVNKPRGFQFSLELDPSRDDSFCANVSNNVPPILNFQAHSVPLDIKFYQPSHKASSASALSLSLSGHAFVSFHGSFNRSPPTGYGVVQFPYPISPASAANGLGYSFVIQAANLTSCPGNCIRPVGLAFSNDDRLFVSSDSSGELFVIQQRLSTLSH